VYHSTPLDPGLELCVNNLGRVSRVTSRIKEEADLRETSFVLQFIGGVLLEPEMFLIARPAGDTLRWTPVVDVGCPSHSLRQLERFKAPCFR